MSVDVSLRSEKRITVQYIALVHHSYHNFCHRVSVVRAWMDGWKLGGVFSLYNTGRRVFMSLCVCVSIIILDVELIHRSKV